VRGLSVMWGVDSDGGDWPFFVKAPEFSRKDVIASSAKRAWPLARKTFRVPNVKNTLD